MQGCGGLGGIRSEAMQADSIRLLFPLFIAKDGNEQMSETSGAFCPTNSTVYRSVF
jgi:hypothetical protein